MAYIGNSPGNIQRGRRAVYEFTATNAQTVFSGTDDNGISLDLQDLNENDVYLNGSRLIFNDDYTIAGEVLTLTAAAAAGDILVIVTQDDIANVASYTKAETDARYINYDGDIVNGDLQISGEVDAGSLIVDTDVLVVDATNNRVGIGTATPSTTSSGYDGGTLHIHNAGTGSSIRLTNSTTGTGTSAGMLISKWNDSKTYFTNFDNDADTIFTQSNSGGSLVTTLVLKGDGKVGIGTSAPDQKLHVSGSGSAVMAHVENISGNYAVNRLSNTALTFDAAIDTSGFYIYDVTNTAERMRIDSSGNVGINNSNPLQKLSVGGRMNVDQQNDYYGAWIDGNTTGDSWFAVGSWYTNGGRMTAGSSEGDGLHLYTHNAGDPVTLQKNGGNVGIGTSSSGNALRVVASSSQATTDGAVVIKNEMNNGFETLKLETNNDRDSVLSFRSVGTNSYWWGMGIDNSDGGKFKMGADNLLGVNNRLVITQAGDVGIGATSPENSLHIKNNTATNGQMLIQGDTNNTYIRMNKSGSTWAIGIDASDSDKFKIGNNSDLSAGTRLTVTTSGKVLINTDDPQDDHSMLRVLNSMANLGGVYIGKVHNSTNTTTGAVLIHKLGQSVGFQFSGKFIVNSWTGNRHIDCHITSYYTNDSISVNSNFTNSGGVAQATVRLCTVSYAGSSWLAFVKDGGGSGVSYLNAFISGNIDYSGGIVEVSSGNYSTTTTHYTF